MLLRIREGTGSPIYQQMVDQVKAQVADGRVKCLVDDARERLPELLRALQARGVIVRDLQVREPDLETVFVELARLS